GLGSVSSDRSGRTVMHASNFSGVASAASTAASERGLPTPSGTTVSGNSVRFCSARTATSNFWPGVDGTGAFSEVSAMQLVLFLTQVDDQKPISVIASNRCSLERRWKLN